MVGPAKRRTIGYIKARIREKSTFKMMSSHNDPLRLSERQPAGQGVAYIGVARRLGLRQRGRRRCDQVGSLGTVLITVFVTRISSELLGAILWSGARNMP